MAVTDNAIDRIKHMIVSGELAPGMRLPREDDLASQLGLSRNSLREAVRALTAMNILITKQGDGTYVSSLEPHLLLEAVAFAADVAQGTAAAQLLEVRRMLEPQATAMAAHLLTDRDLAALRTILDQSVAAETVDSFIEWDIAFHRTIIEAVGNPVLSMLLDTLSTRTQRIRIIRGAELASALDSVHREHAAILRALESRDAALSASAAMIHVHAVEQWVRGGLRREEASAEPA